MGLNVCNRSSKPNRIMASLNTLHIDSLTMSYDNKVILSDIFLSCKQGQIKGLIGRNGSGKSTLLKIIFGTEKPNSKYVRVGNKIIKTISDSRHLINYLPQDNFLPKNIKIKTIIQLFLPKANRTIVLNNDFIKPLLNKKSQTLSGGEKRIVEILLIVHSNAKFVLLDEPFNGLSPIIKEYIIKYLKKMKPTKGFIITDHDYENVIHVADKIVFLKEGFLKEIKNNSELIDLGYIPKKTFNIHLNN